MNARSPTEAGFTIVETLIFLAISGLMFVLAIGAMSGKQQQTEFQTGVDTFQSQLNQALSDVSTGSYNYQDEVSGNYTSCTGASGTIVISTSSSTIPIPNPDGTCSAVGEILEFGSGSSGQLYYTIPVFGCTFSNCNSTNDDYAITLAEAEPTIDSSDYISTNMPFGLKLDTTNNTPPGAFGVFSFTSFSGNNDGNNLSSGSSHVEIFTIPDFSYSSNHTPNDLTEINNGKLTSSCPGSNEVCIVNNGEVEGWSQVNPSSGLQFCVDSGTTDNQSALFTIGGTNSPTSASYQIYSNSSGCSND